MINPLAFTVGDLAGACLSGSTRAQLLASDWFSDAEGPRRVRDLAHVLVSSSIT